MLQRSSVGGDEPLTALRRQKRSHTIALDSGGMSPVHGHPLSPHSWAPAGSSSGRDLLSPLDRSPRRSSKYSPRQQRGRRQRTGRAAAALHTAAGVIATPRGGVYSAIPTVEPLDENHIAEPFLEEPPVEPEEAGPWPKRVTESLHFQGIMACMIVLNALVIGLETDCRSFKYWDLIEDAFLVIFLGELGLKMCALGLREYFNYRNADICWNMFDFLIVFTGVADLIFGFIVGRSGGGMATLFRIIRLLRILRIVRIVKFLKQLYLLAFGMFEAAQAVFWVSILMCFVLYICAIVMVKTVGRPDASDPHEAFLRQHFGNVPSSMLTLFVLMSSPNLPVYQDEIGLLESRPLLTLFLIVFILFGSFGMIALLTGVISESMFEKNDLRKDEARQELETMHETMGLRCGTLFDMLEHNEEGEANQKDVFNLMPEIVELFESTGSHFTKEDLTDMITFMDVDGSGTVSRKEFIHALQQLAEGLRPITIQEVQYEIGVCRVKLQKIEDLFEKSQQPQHSDVSGSVEALVKLQKLEDSMDWMKEHHEQLASTMSMLVGRVEACARVSPDDLARCGAAATAAAAAELRAALGASDDCGIPAFAAAKAAKAACVAAEGWASGAAHHRDCVPCSCGACNCVCKPLPPRDGQKPAPKAPSAIAPPPPPAPQLPAPAPSASSLSRFLDSQPAPEQSPAAAGLSPTASERSPQAPRSPQTQQPLQSRQQQQQQPQQQQMQSRQQPQQPPQQQPQHQQSPTRPQLHGASPDAAVTPSPAAAVLPPWQEVNAGDAGAGSGAERWPRGLAETVRAMERLGAEAEDWARELGGIQAYLGRAAQVTEAIERSNDSVSELIGRGRALAQSQRQMQARLRDALALLEEQPPPVRPPPAPSSALGPSATPTAATGGAAAERQQQELPYVAPTESEESMSARAHSLADCDMYGV
eukprot:TRINITY_DN11237_c0_g1_i1.p1 TRINITY_DN11237_c0_g1~~TRINITY_DN11237_c0_g1_i1.p1  ORF type:complete len:933 (+),score=238.70 TRINITY_DN11237_c0_g1_i1:125-2923(+)